MPQKKADLSPHSHLLDRWSSTGEFRTEILWREKCTATFGRCTLRRKAVTSHRTPKARAPPSALMAAFAGSFFQPYFCWNSAGESVICSPASVNAT